MISSALIGSALGVLAGWLISRLVTARLVENDILMMLSSGPKTSLELSTIHPRRVYPALRNLVRQGRIVRHEGPPSAARGGRPVITYSLVEKD